MTNKERKSLMRARWTETNPVKFARLGVAHRLEYRLGQKNWGQLCKWLRRVTERRKDLQAKFVIAGRRLEKLGAKTGPPNDKDIREMLLLQQVQAAANIRAKVLDTFLEAVEEEIERRKKAWAAVKTLIDKVEAAP
jgi:hypothetical protein